MSKWHCNSQEAIIEEPGMWHAPTVYSWNISMVMLRIEKKSIYEAGKLGNPFFIEVINGAPSPQNEKPLGTYSELCCCNFI